MYGLYVGNKMFLFQVLFIFVSCGCVLSMHESAPCIQCALGGQEKKLEPLELEFQVDVSCLHVVGTESVPSEEQCTLLASNTSPAPTECCVLCDVTFRCLMALEKQCEKNKI